jgi:hypothetical protein
MEPQAHANAQPIFYLVRCIQGASFSCWAQMKSFVLQFPFPCRVIPREGFPLIGNLYAERSFALRKVQKEPLAVSDLTALSVEHAGVDAEQYFYEQMVTLVDRFQHPLLVPQGKRTCDTTVSSLPPAKRQRKDLYAFSVWKRDKNNINKPAEVRCAFQCKGPKKKHYGSLYCPSRKQWACKKAFLEDGVFILDGQRNYHEVRKHVYNATPQEDRIRTVQLFLVRKEDEEQQQEISEPADDPESTPEPADEPEAEPATAETQGESEALLEDIVIHKGDLPALQYLWEKLANLVEGSPACHKLLLRLNVFDIATESVYAYPSALGDLVLGLLDKLANTIAALPITLMLCDDQEDDFYPIHHPVPAMKTLLRIEHPQAMPLLLRLWNLHNDFIMGCSLDRGEIGRAMEKHQSRAEQAEKMRAEVRAILDSVIDRVVNHVLVAAA